MKLKKRYQHTEAATDCKKSFVRYFWYDMRNDIEDYVKRCDACQRVNPKMTTEKPALHCVPVPKAAFQQVGIDLISLPETAEGFKYVVVLADYFTK